MHFLNFFQEAGRWTIDIGASSSTVHDLPIRTPDLREGTGLTMNPRVCVTDSKLAAAAKAQNRGQASERAARRSWFGCILKGLWEFSTWFWLGSGRDGAEVWGPRCGSQCEEGRHLGIRLNEEHLKVSPQGSQATCEGSGKRGAFKQGEGKISLRSLCVRWGLEDD